MHADIISERSHSVRPTGTQQWALVVLGVQESVSLCLWFWYVYVCMYVLMFVCVWLCINVKGGLCVCVCVCVCVHSQVVTSSSHEPFAQRFRRALGLTVVMVTYTSGHEARKFTLKGKHFE